MRHAEPDITGEQRFRQDSLLVGLTYIAQSIVTVT
jgi:hypothetical protein